jgi:DHA2 family methylenomycin A resistance protein-like MFS transporter
MRGIEMTGHSEFVAAPHKPASLTRRLTQTSAANQRRVLAATSLSYVVVLLDASIVNVALDRLSLGLATDVAGLQWVVNAYTMAFASLLLTGGTLGDRWGARRIYLAGLFVFTLASMGCGLAPSLPALIIARILQGIGAAMLAPCALKLINHACPDPEQRARAIGIWVGCGGVAMAAGPIIGGLLIHLFDWRSIFFVNAPIGLAAFWMTWRIEADQKPSRAPGFDPVGQISAIVALGALIGVLIEGRTLGWTSPPILAGAAATIAASALFLATEARVPRPMLPMSFFRSGIFAGSTFVSMASAFVFYGLLFVLSLYYQQARGYSPLLAGLALLPMTAMVAVGSIASKSVATILGTRWSMCAAFAVYASGALGMLAASADSPYWLAVAPMLAIGLASGFVSPAATAPAMGTVEKQRAGIAGAVLNSGRQTGAALGVAVFGTLLGALHPFAAGMQAALWVAAMMSMIAALVWRRAVDAGK